MEYITTTNLRTQSSQLVGTLKRGGKVTLIHRSKVIGKIVPESGTAIKTIDAQKLNKKINELDFPKLTLKEIDRRYRIAMMKKHGKGLS